ncbi:hypothetical protein GN300_06990 [Rhodococcus sp. Ni2]|nr:hypothetical protein [Rhodococcus sp. Ni2]
MAALAIGTVTACSTDAEVASKNLSKAADQFEIDRRIVFFNGITDKYLLTIEGRCSIEPDGGKLDVTCKTAGGFKKHFLGLSDNVSYFVEQLEGASVSTDHYRVIFKPETIIPNVSRP